MKKKILYLLLVLFTFPIAIFAKINPSDTTFFYVSKDHQLCAPDTAFFIIKKFKLNDKLWSKVEMEVKSLDTNYEQRSFDSSFKQLEDTSLHMSTDMVVQEIYKKGKLLKANLYDRSYRLEGYEILASNGKDVKEQKGWDSLGNEIPNYICLREARFDKEKYGGSWHDFLVSHLDRDLPKKMGAPHNLGYLVIVQFSVDKDGKIINVRALNNPGFGTAEQAVSIVKSSPDWIPAIQNNQPVIYRQKQQITFNVE